MSRPSPRRAPQGAFLVTLQLAWIFLGALLCLALAGAAQAASLQVSPVRFELPAKDASQSLWVSNNGEAPIHVQVRVYRWTQEGGQDVLTPTTEVMVSPALTQVQPGARQLVRIVRQGTFNDAERSYRIRVEELPSKRQTTEKRPALNLVLAYSLPLFLVQQPTGGNTASRLQASVANTTLEVHNSGTHRAMLSNLRAVDAAGNETLIHPGLLGYVLAGNTMRFTIAPKGRFSMLRATVNQDQTAEWPAGP